MKKLFVFLLFVFITHSVFATIMCDDSSGGYVAIYEINSYTCNSGEFLPANTLGCQSCPANATCTGGTFDFDPNFYQGLDFNNFSNTTMNNVCANNFPTTLYAKYAPNEHTCNAGYYLPAAVDACTQCPENNYCSGGTYMFNETVDQGIVSCGTGLYSPAGMWEAAQCGRILHIGDEVVYLRATKKTTPSLNIDIDGDGIADYFGNMTTLDVPMTNGTQRKLKISYGGQTYSVYDDSVDLTQYQNEP